MAKITINAKELRATLPAVVERVRKGSRFTVIYRSRPAFEIVPVEGTAGMEGRLDGDPLYGAGAVGSSTDRRSSVDHDATLYGR